MSSLPPSSKYLQQASAAVDDGEREALTKRLSDAFADGRMGQDEYMAALDTVYGAQQLGELVPVIEQLPAAAVDTPSIVSTTSSASAGHVSASRNILLPALLVTGVILALLIALAVLGFALFGIA